MDYQSSNIFEIWKELATLTVNGVKEIDNALETQSLRIDVIYDNLLQSAQKNATDVPEKKMSKRQSKTKSSDQVGDLFSTESGFQQPAVPPVRRTRRQASIAAVDKKKSERESTIISSFGTATRASRARALSTFMDIDLDGPKGNSTFVVDKKLKENIEECLSPEMFSPENGISTKQNKTYNLSDKCVSKKVSKKFVKNMNIKPEDSNNESKETSSTNKQCEKLEDIQVNIEEPSRHVTRTMKRKLQEDDHVDAKKPNVVFLEKQISTPLKSIDDLTQQTPHQIRENKAEKRKELYLKNKADQKKFDEQHLKVAKQREEQMKRVEEKIKKAAEEKRIKEEKQKEKELMLKEETLKKQKLAEIRLAEINAKRKQAEELKLIKMNKAEMDRKLKENEMKKKNELKSEKAKSSRLKTVTTNLPIPSVLKTAALPKPKAGKNETNKNDYGLNDISARDSSEDESGPKKAVPDWAKRENRTDVLGLQYHVDSSVRDLFFDCPTTVSLKEIFKGMHIRDKQRTSSAVWNTPLRYSEYIRKY